MIDEQRTLEIYGYSSDELSKGSHKPVVAVCEDCGKYRVVEVKAYRDLCKSCVGTYRSAESRKKASEKMLGKKAWNKGLKDNKETKKRKTRVLIGNHRSKGCTQNLSHEVRLKRSESMIGNKYNDGKKASGITKGKMSASAMGHAVSDKTKGKISANHARYWKGKSPSEETRRKLSASGQGIPLVDWTGYVTENPYCKKFNESCRERNREKYGGVCFICGKTKEQNSNRSLSVHHISKNKMEGCDGSKWQLIPLCMSCHGKAHTEPLQSRTCYLIKQIESRPFNVSEL